MAEQVLIIVLLHTGIDDSSRNPFQNEAAFVSRPTPALPLDLHNRTSTAQAARIPAHAPLVYRLGFVRRALEPLEPLVDGLQLDLELPCFGSPPPTVCCRTASCAVQVE
jgi:hypothetical protein